MTPRYQPTQEGMGYLESLRTGVGRFNFNMFSVPLGSESNDSSASGLCFWKTTNCTAHYQSITDPCAKFGPPKEIA